jgi:hypothetical protein
MFAPRRLSSPRIFLSPLTEDATDWPGEDGDGRPEPEEIDDDWSLELDDEYWDALLLDDDYEPDPEYGDFWPDQDAA